jgi:hypothetical protein
MNKNKQTNMSYAKLQRSQNRKSDREMTKYFHDKYNLKNKEHNAKYIKEYYQKHK